MARRGPTRFDAAVYAVVRRVPAGYVVTYGQVATIVGAPRAARAVGQAMHRCPPGIPWHRVVNAGGAVSRRPNASSMVSQRLLLEREGVRFRKNAIDLGRHRWAPAGRRLRVDIDALPAW